MPIRFRHPGFRPSDRPAARRAFTLIELLVAIAITVAVVFMVNEIFRASTETVSRGSSLSKLIGQARVAVQQIDEDADKMIGSGTTDKGLLVILQHRINDVPMPTSARQRSGETTRNIRSDQLAFLRQLSANDFPLTPSQKDNTFFNGNNGSGKFARVWYGHTPRTFPSGYSNTGDTWAGTDSAAEVGDLGEQGAGEAGSPNLLGHHWILGRQAMFLNGASPAGTVWAQNDRADYNAPVAGLTTPEFNDPRVYKGYTDISEAGIADVIDDGAAGGRDMIEAWNHDSSTGNEPTYPAYKARAYWYTFGQRRLWSNPNPVFDASDTVKRYYPRQIAQLHPILLVNVSDVIVEFAADITNTAFDPPSAPANYNPDGVIDVDTDGNLIWYAHYANTDLNVVTPPNDYPAYDLNVGIENPNSPSPGGTMGAMPYADAGFVWRHNDEATPNPEDSAWPYLIRIRFRLHDDRGKIGGKGSEQGIWFEQIIPVPRQP